MVFRRDIQRSGPTRGEAFLSDNRKFRDEVKQKEGESEGQIQ